MEKSLLTATPTSISQHTAIRQTSSPHLNTPNEHLHEFYIVYLKMPSGNILTEPTQVKCPLGASRYAAERAEKKAT